MDVTLIATAVLGAFGTLCASVIAYIQTRKNKRDDNQKEFVDDLMAQLTEARTLNKVYEDRIKQVSEWWDHERTEKHRIINEWHNDKWMLEDKAHEERAAGQQAILELTEKFMQERVTAHEEMASMRATIEAKDKMIAELRRQINT